MPLRALIILTALGLAAPAAAQDSFALTVQRDAELYAQADSARQRDVELTNRLSTLEARLQTDRAMSDIVALRQPPALSTVYDPKRPVAGVAPTYASMPDDKLAASNAAVRAAAANRR